VATSPKQGPQGRERYQLKPSLKNGTTHVEVEPVEFIAKLAALVPPPRAHLIRFHGVFAPNANLRAQLHDPAAANRRSQAPTSMTAQTLRNPTFSGPAITAAALITSAPNSKSRNAHRTNIKCPS